ncbi:MAG: polysaccharide deacetylase family protein [Ornithinimicrobium sp.]
MPRPHPIRTFLALLLPVVLILGVAGMVLVDLRDGGGPNAGGQATPGQSTSGSNKETEPTGNEPDLPPLDPQKQAGAAETPTVVSLTYDDGFDDQAGAARVLDHYGVDGTFYVTDDFIDDPGYMTRADLDALQRNGHEIGGHTVTHPRLGEIDAAEARREICNDRATLFEWGFEPVNMAYPFTSSTPQVEQIAEDCGYLTSRGLGEVKSQVGCELCVLAETMPPENSNFLRAPAQIDSSWNLDDVKSIVRQAQAYGGGWVIFTFHTVCEPIGTKDCEKSLSATPQLHADVVEWLYGQSQASDRGLSVHSVDEVVRSYLGDSYPEPEPPERAPGPEVAPTGKNAVTNPSLESVDPTTGVPACFMRGDWGDNTVELESTSPGSAGDTAITLTITDYEDGEGKILPQFDLGTCSPSVEPGATYDLRVDYRLKGTAQMALYYRDAQDHWQYWMSGPYVEQRNAWATANFRTPPVPKGATGLSFGLSLISDGTLETDRYRMVAADD